MFKKKKSLAIIIGSFALALVLIVPLALSSTFSKYYKTSTPANNETATVAGFGVTLNAATGTLFSNSYVKTDVSTSIGENSVDYTSESGKTLAPGTSNGDGFSVSATINGNEVAVRLGLTITTTSANWSVTPDGGETTDYTPVKFIISSNDGTSTTYWNGTSWVAESAELTQAQVTSIGASNDFAVAQTNKTITYNIKWSWAFDGGNDAYDTLLGEAETKATIAMTVSLTATQID